MGAVFLIGFMACGKTTLGSALAARHPEMEFIDLDDEAEQVEGMSVAEIFARKGEPYFRQLESQLLRSVGGRPNVIVGCGGGTPCHGGNMEWMNANGLTVRLVAPLDVTLRRLREGGDKRPLVAGKTDEQLRDDVIRRLASRDADYSKAAMTFDSSQLESEEQIERSCRRFMTLISNHMK